MLITGLTILCLLILSAYFSGSETALTAASRSVMHQKELDGNGKAAIVNRLREHQERLIGAVLLGNNLANILASSLATSVMIAAFGETGVVYATTLMTLLVIIFAEILPKTYALNRADKTALVIAPVMRVMVFVLAPITQAIQLLVNATLRIFGYRDHARDAGAAEAELRGAIELHAEDGTDDAGDDERAMLHSILDLDDMDVWEIMVHRKNVEMLDISDPPRVLINAVLASRYTRLPLYQDDPENIVGVLHAKDLLRAMAQYAGREEQINIRDLATEPWFIPDSTSLVAQLKAFKERREHFAFVVDEYGAMEGVVSLEDILEEIVGDIRDEHDLPSSVVLKQADGRYSVRGDVSIRELNRRFEWRLPDEEAATIAGLLLFETRRIPAVGQRFRFHGLEFEVLRRHRNQITRLRIGEITGSSVNNPDLG